MGNARRFATDLSAAKLAVSLGRRPLVASRRLGSLASELVKITAGASTLAPAKRDRRFADPAWTQNPVLRRILQAYLAAGQTVGQLVDDAALNSRDDKRVRFGAENLVEALSPSNVPRSHRRAGQPAGQPEGHHQVSDTTPADPADWLQAAQTQPGSWWPDLAVWLDDRCGPDKRAPRGLGGGGLLPLTAAPGTYVFGT